ncbi:hypothetical protein PG994_010462 [Apiospora phragmitis]|uniref:Methyltransferase type 11 domain-containing protein n=1 Tax=Apiospora phragmitis TaxID=2905665 RepID=A0ABR1TQ81_9PEZI
MAPPAKDYNNLAESLQDQFNSVPVTAENHDAKRALADAMDRVMGLPGERLLAQAGLLPPPPPAALDHGAVAPKDKKEEEEEPFALFDNACGAGLITGLLQKKASPAVLRESRIVCADLNANFIDIVKWRAETDRWMGTVETMVADAQDTGLPANSFSHVVINFAMHIIPKPEVALRGWCRSTFVFLSLPLFPLTLPPSTEAYRLLRPNGTLAFTVWAHDNTGWIPDMHSAFAALPFAATAPLMPDHVPMAVHGLDQWIDPAGIRAELTHSSLSFEDVRIEKLEHTSRVDNAEYFVEKFDMMRKWLMQSYWSEESRQAAAELGGGMDEIMTTHLLKKHGRNGWDIRWKSILVTCRKP